MAKGRTTIAVAHRLATIQKADIIYVLGEGKVLEKGNHHELLRKKGVYWHMVSHLIKVFLKSRMVMLTGKQFNSAIIRPLTGDVVSVYW